MQAIKTKYLPPTNSRGARLVASCDAKRITVAWDYSLGQLDNHIAAAQRLASDLVWLDGYRLATGCMDEYFVHVLVRKTDGE
jgi:hypothetical protein